MKRLQALLDWGGIQRDILFLALSAAALISSIFHLPPLPFDAAWVAIILCGVPIVLEAVIGLVTAFDIKADVLCPWPSSPQYASERTLPPAR